MMTVRAVLFVFIVTAAISTCLPADVPPLGGGGGFNPYCTSIDVEYRWIGPVGWQSRSCVYDYCADTVTCTPWVKTDT